MAALRHQTMMDAMEIDHMNEQIRALKDLSRSTEPTHLDDCHEDVSLSSDDCYDSDDSEYSITDDDHEEYMTTLNDQELINMLQKELFQRRSSLNEPSRTAMSGYGTSPRKPKKASFSAMKHCSSSSDLMTVNEDFMTTDVQASYQRFLQRRSASMENLIGADDTMRRNRHGTNTATASTTASATAPETPKEKPQECLKSLLAQKGIKYKTFKAASLLDRGFFVPMKQENYEDYTNDVAFAARQGDLHTLKIHVRSGKNALCCNRHNESIIHTMCRKGHLDLLEYALGEGAATLRICCDQQRTPLHDAAWTHQPNFRMIELILSQCPDLLYIEDNRGFTALDYVAPQQWGDWCRFLEKNRDLLVPQRL